ncbi:MAG: D-2-hydroxyacid dehydrogenase [Halioglobus sp.]|nr:D-2-hydroxyacid dehydrogenase [Halioglobus sp.]
MPHKTPLYLLFGVMALLVAPLATPDELNPDPIIAQLGLREGDTPMSERRGWSPQKVLVMTMPGYPELGAAYKDALRAAAGDMELVIPEGGLALTQETLAEVDGVIGFCTPKLLQAAGPQLRWVHNYSVGMDWCKGASEQQLENVVFSNNQRLSGPAIAEHTVAMLLALSRNLPAYLAAQAEGQWQRQLATGVTFGELRGKTLLVAGLGGIGTEIARRAHGLGMRVIATRNSRREGPEFVEYVGLADELLTLAGRADVVVNALPLTDRTTALFDAKFFRAVKPGAIFLSVGRGKSTVTPDLIAALQSGRLYGAGLDVTDPEPLPKDSPLWQMDNVIITPHVSAAGRDSRRRTLSIAVENLRRYVQGEPLLNVVDLRRGY